MSQLFASDGKSIGTSASVLLMNIQVWFPSALTSLISLKFKGLSRVFSSTTVQNHRFFGAQPSLWSNSHAAVMVHNDFGAQENKSCYCFHFFSFYLPWGNGTRCHDLSFLDIAFQTSFSLSSFPFIKRLFSFSSLSAIKVVSSAYLMLLIFLQAILIPACHLSSPAFHMGHSV